MVTGGQGRWGKGRCSPKGDNERGETEKRKAFEECWEQHCYLTMSRVKMAGNIPRAHTSLLFFFGRFFVVALFVKLINNSIISQETRLARIKPSPHFILHAQHTPQRASAPWNASVFNTSYTRPCSADPSCHIVISLVTRYFT